MDPISRLRIGLVLAGLGVLVMPVAVLPALMEFSVQIGAAIGVAFLLVGLGFVASAFDLPRTLRSEAAKGGMLYWLPAFGAVLLVALSWTWSAVYVIGLVLVAVGALWFGFGASTWGAQKAYEQNLRHIRIGALFILVGAACWAVWYLMLFTAFRQVANPDIVVWEAGSLLFFVGFLLVNLGLRFDLKEIKEDGEMEGHEVSPEEPDWTIEDVPVGSSEQTMGPVWTPEQELDRPDDVHWEDEAGGGPAPRDPSSLRSSGCKRAPEEILVEQDEQDQQTWNDSLDRQGSASGAAGFQAPQEPRVEWDHGPVPNHADLNGDSDRVPDELVDEDDERVPEELVDEDDERAPEELVDEDFERVPEAFLDGDGQDRVHEFLSRDEGSVRAPEEFVDEQDLAIEDVLDEWSRAPEELLQTRVRTADEVLEDWARNESFGGMEVRLMRGLVRRWGRKADEVLEDWLRNESLGGLQGTVEDEDSGQALGEAPQEALGVGEGEEYWPHELVAMGNGMKRDGGRSMRRSGHAER